MYYYLAHQLSVLLYIQLFMCIPSVRVNAVRNIQVVFPLQSLTIWDPEVQEQTQQGENDLPSVDDEVSKKTYRSQFLSKFRIGLQAEIEARNQLSSSSVQQELLLQQQQKAKGNKKNWAEKAAMNDYTKHRLEEELVEKAYDAAIATKAAEHNTKILRKNKNKYQFVGVINNHPNKDSSNTEPPIVWYSRKKPKNAKWTIRLVHVNRQAILKDLYNRKKIDIFVKYNNEGISSSTGAIDNSKLSSSSTYKPVVTGQYHVRERTWKNLWNMSLKHMFTDSSGMYWRERRIHSSNTKNQLYTDGNMIYEATYRYIDGRNGMHKLSSLQEYLNSRSIDAKLKVRILHRLANDVPDLVLEE